MKYCIVLNRNHTIIWSGYVKTENEAWSRMMVETKTPSLSLTIEQLQEGRYGLRLVSWEA